MVYCKDKTTLLLPTGKWHERSFQNLTLFWTFFHTLPGDHDALNAVKRNKSQILFLLSTIYCVYCSCMLLQLEHQLTQLLYIITT